MNDILYEWLKNRWMYDNHKKYHKYFNEWVLRLTDIQIEYFEKQRKSLIEGSKLIKK